MDPKNLFIKSSTYYRLVNWQKQDGEEWSYVGADSDFDLARASEFISVLKGEQIYFVTNRSESKLVNKENLLTCLKDRVLDGNFILWDLSFEVIVEFNRIGIARQGRRV
jgi:predicted secreted acid phosphatase